MIYFISDTHFNHDRQFIWGPRNFKSVDAMNSDIVKKWNSVVTDNDVVYVVGDFFLGADINFVKIMLKTLRGKIILVRGNHDTDAKVKIYEESTKVEKIVWADQICYNNHNYFICHYPTLTATLESNPKSAVRNIFGHTHSKEKFYEGKPFMYNVACDAHDCTPVSIEQIDKDIEDEIKLCFSYLV